jgi:chromosome segregation ATPase
LPKCEGFSTSLKNPSLLEELKVKQTIIARLREQLEHKIKQVLQLKLQIKQEREVNYQKRASEKYREDLVSLKHDYNVLVVKNARLTMELKTVRSETEAAHLKLVKAKNYCKDFKIEIKELRDVLNS